MGAALSKAIMSDYGMETTVRKCSQCAYCGGCWCVPPAHGPAVLSYLMEISEAATYAAIINHKHTLSPWRGTWAGFYLLVFFFFFNLTIYFAAANS